MLFIGLVILVVAVMARDVAKAWIRKTDMSTWQGNQIELLRGRIKKLEERLDALDGSR